MDSISQVLTYKYRLNPRRSQHAALNEILEQQRQLFNAALQERDDFYRTHREAFLNARVYREQLTLYKKRIRAWITTARRSGQENHRDAAIRLFHEYRLFRRHKPAMPQGPNELSQSRALTQIRAADPAWAQVQRRIQRATLKRVERAFAAFFRRAKAGETPGYPKYKGREFFDGFEFDAFQQITLIPQKNRQPLPDEGGEQKQRRGSYPRLHFAGMPGGLRVFLDRELPSDPKKIWFKREGRRWYVGFQVARECAAPRQTGTNIGLDWGTSALAVLSSGEVIKNPRHREALADRLRIEERAVARKKRGSKRRLKARRHKQAIERKIRNRRKNTLNKLSKRLATQYRMVATEEFSVKAMLTHGSNNEPHLKKRRNREALDAAPYMLRQMIAYKTKLYGATHGAGGAPDYDKRSSTNICSGPIEDPVFPYCWQTVSKELSAEWHHCPYCGYVTQRKHNAARVILIRALYGGGPVPAGAKRGNSPVCPGNTSAAATPQLGRRPSGLHPTHSDRPLEVVPSG